MKIQKYSSNKIANNYDAIIIGSGISGLCTAALLSMNNQKVLVLEKHFKVGGYTHTFKRQNFEWDVGIHYIGGVHLKKTFTRRLFDKITNSNLKWNKMSDNYDRIIFPDKSYDFIAPKHKFIENMKCEREPGTLCHYNSGDTQALGMLLVRATGHSITAYMQEKLCEPLGMESEGYWLLDCEGMELAAGGVNLIARDFARLGELYRNKGVWNGKQIVPANWVTDSVTPDAPHLMPGQVIVGGHVFPFGYGYQWWIPEGDRGEFAAIGVYNQFVYVDPSRNVVIVKLSANRAYGTSPDESTNREAETMEFLRAIATSL